MKKVFFILVLISIGLVFLGIYLFKQEQPHKPSSQLITVYISGGVLLEGQYDVAKETTLNDLIGYAKLKESADISSLDLNQTLVHNKTYHIPINHLQEKININTATVEVLQQLDGIGPVTAQDIVNYRIRYGPFKNISEIKNVPGIKDSKYEKIRDYITV